MSDLAALATRIRASLADVEQVVQRTFKISQKALISGDDDYWEFVQFLESAD